MERSDAAEEAATALGLGYLTPDQRKVLLKLWDRGWSEGWTVGHREGFNEGLEDW